MRAWRANGSRVLQGRDAEGGHNGTTRFLWGGAGNWQCLEERDGDDDLAARYTYSPDYIDAVAVQERDLNSDDDFADDDEVVYYLSNTLYSVYALVDADENVIERYRYDAYGACTVLDADGSADSDGISDVSNAYAFTARRLDTETGLMQYRNRYYSPTFGRFVSRDPVGYWDARSLYAYAKHLPVNSGDPTGLSSDLERCLADAEADYQNCRDNAYGVYSGMMRACASWDAGCRADCAAKHLPDDLHAHASCVFACGLGTGSCEVSAFALLNALFAGCRVDQVAAVALCYTGPPDEPCCLTDPTFCVDVTPF